MTAAVLLAVGTSPESGEATAAECVASLRGAGRKALVVPPPEPGALSAAPELAVALGLSAAALHAGCSVPFAAETDRWEGVTEECAAGSRDAVVVTVASPAAALALATAPERLRRVVRAILDDIGPSGESGRRLATLLAVDRRCVAHGALSMGGDTVVVEPEAGGHRSAGPGLALLGLRRTTPRRLVSVLDAMAAGTAERAPLDVRPGGSGGDDGYVWSLDLGGAGSDDVELWLERDATGAWLELSLAGLSRAIPLPAALRRCLVAGASVRRGRLDVELVPDPAAWRWS